MPLSTLALQTTPVPIDQHTCRQTDMDDDSSDGELRSDRMETVTGHEVVPGKCLFVRCSDTPRLQSLGSAGSRSSEERVVSEPRSRTTSKTVNVKSGVRAVPLLHWQMSCTSPVQPDVKRKAGEVKLKSRTGAGSSASTRKRRRVQEGSNSSASESAGEVKSCRRSSSSGSGGNSSSGALFSAGVTLARETQSLALAKHQRSNDCEVYVGDLPPDTDLRTIELAFSTLFRKLPDFAASYSNLSTVVAGYKEPNFPDRPNTRFVFVEFHDAVLATTATQMSGLRIRGRSARVSRPEDGPQNWEEVPGLDVSCLRQEGLLPFCGGPGAQMLLDVYIGLVPNDQTTPQTLANEVTSAVLSVPAIQMTFPDLQAPVVDVSMEAGASFAFIEFAHEVVASTVVAMGFLQLDGGAARVGFPTRIRDAASRAAPSLVPSLTGCLSHQAGVGARKSDTQECEVYLGNIRHCDSESLRTAFEDLFNSLPSFKKTYPEGTKPVVNVDHKGLYAFVRLLDPVLASTAVALDTLEVEGRRVPMCRPKAYTKSTRLVTLAPPLTISDARHAKSRVPTASLWIGNIPRVGAWRSDLEDHLTKLAMALPGGCDIEAGPPIAHVSLHPSWKFGFVEIRDASLAGRLLNVFDGSDYFGFPLSVTWARRGNHVRGNISGENSRAVDPPTECVGGGVEAETDPTWENASLEGVSVTSSTEIDMCDI